MSDRERPYEDDEHEDDPRADEGREDSHLDTGETSGLGLTEEFARIEAEIEGGIEETGEHDRAGQEPYPHGDAADEDEDEDEEHYEDGEDFEEEELESEPGQATEEWDRRAHERHPDTAEEWITAEEATGEPGRYGETGEYDSVPDTGEWAEESVAPAAAAGDAGDAGRHEQPPEPEPIAEDEAFDDEDEDEAEDQAVGEEEPAEEPEPAPGDEPDQEPGPDRQAEGEASPSEARTEVQRPGEAVPVAAAAGAAAGAPEATEVRPPATDPGSLTPIPPSRPPGPPAIPEDELDLKVPSLWLRFLSGSVLIIVSVAASVAIAGLLFLSDVAAKLQPIPGIQEQLTEVESDDPQTILIIGSDRRASDPEGVGARSDTTMLLRVDPDKKVLSLFSLPRDLKVNIPGYGVGKLNEAYTIGGEKKTLKTVAQFTGLDINHVVEINFDGFADAVNAIDCVYIDVDRDYFNDNSQALSDAETYSAIDINSGYQRLCGLKALQYVRYRHTDTDLVRAARQQDFLREARQKVEPRELIPGIGGTGNELIDIFTKYTRSDISESSDVIGILKSFIAVRDVTVNEVHFEGDIGDATSTYVTSTSDQVSAAIDEFLNGPPEPADEGGGDEEKKPEADKKPKPDNGGDKEKSSDPLDNADVVATSELPDAETGGTQAERFEADANKNARRMDIPIFYPQYLVPGSAFDTGSRTYEYENEDNKKEEAYKTVIAYTTPSTLTEYYGVMGTTWDDPPILRNPSETREYNGRDYDLFYDGDRLRMVGWHEDGNSYWLNNTLTQTLGENEMLAIATTMKEIK